MMYSILISYQDPETAELIRRLNSKKAAAVKGTVFYIYMQSVHGLCAPCFSPQSPEERFDYAKQLKQVVDELQKVST